MNSNLVKVALSAVRFIRSVNTVTDKVALLAGIYTLSRLAGELIRLTESLHWGDGYL